MLIEASNWWRERQQERTATGQLWQRNTNYRKQKKAT